jgi:hypothetical protein
LPVEPSDTPCANEERNAETLLSPFTEPVTTVARQCSRSRELRGAFRRGSPPQAPSRVPALEPCACWPTGAGAARVHRCSKTSTRPFSAPLSRAFRGRVRFLDFCRSMFQRARQWTARTSRTSGPGRLPRSIVSFRSRTNRRRYAGSGAEDHRTSTFLPGLLPEETSPQPRSLQTPRVAGIARRPVRSGRGKRAMPPALRALARHAQREGRATPDLREKNRRSPTRGAFRRKAVRKRGGPSIGVSRLDR